MNRPARDCAPPGAPVSPGSPAPAIPTAPQEQAGQDHHRRDGDMPDTTRSTARGTGEPSALNGLQLDGGDPDWLTRIRLARSILEQRPIDGLTAELAVLALRGATVADLHVYERAAS
jgi:hypothetical protein